MKGESPVWEVVIECHLKYLLSMDLHTIQFLRPQGLSGFRWKYFWGLCKAYIIITNFYLYIIHSIRSKLAVSNFPVRSNETFFDCLR